MCQKGVGVIINIDVQSCLLGYTAWWRQYTPLKRRSTIILHGSISQKTTLNIILAAVRTWTLTWRTHHMGIFHYMRSTFNAYTPFMWKDNSVCYYLTRNIIISPMEFWWPLSVAIHGLSTLLLGIQASMSEVCIMDTCKWASMLTSRQSSP
jgi:hypothetical protein